MYNPVEIQRIDRQIEDLQRFDSDAFVNALFDVKMEEEDAFA